MGVTHPFEASRPKVTNVHLHLTRVVCDLTHMTDYRRNRVPGGTYFFTVNLLDRRSNLLTRTIQDLREAVRHARASARRLYPASWAKADDDVLDAGERVEGARCDGLHPSYVTKAISGSP